MSGSSAAGGLPRVSFIIPLHNGGPTMLATLETIVLQSYRGPIEISVYDDCSSDNGVAIIQAWQRAIEARTSGTSNANGSDAHSQIDSALNAIDNVAIEKALSAAPGPRSIVLTRPSDVGAAIPCGPGFGRNRATEASTGEWLATSDADDEHDVQRIELQLGLATSRPDGGRNLIIGGRFTRMPEGSTPAYTAWANSLSDDDVLLQQWRECTIIHPTWFMHRSVYDRVGGYDEKPHPMFDTGREHNNKTQHDSSITLAAVTSNSSSSSLSGSASSAAATGVHVPSTSSPSAPAQPENPIYVLPNVAAEGRAPSADTFLSSSSSSSDNGSAVATYHLSRHPPILNLPPPRLSAQEKGGGRVFAAFPEDLLFFHRHLAAGGSLAQVHTPILRYRYSPTSQSYKIPRQFLLRLRAALFEERVLARDHAWRQFVIWGAGRDGKAFYNALSPAGQAAVAAFAEVDDDKIGLFYPAPAKGAKAKARKEQSAAAKAANAADKQKKGKAAAVISSDNFQPAAAPAASITTSLSTDAVMSPADDSSSSHTICVCGGKRPRPNDTAEPCGLCSAKRRRTNGTDSSSSAAAPLAPATALLAAGEGAVSTVFPGPRPIRHFSQVRGLGPIVCCVYLETGGAELRANIASLGPPPPVEGRDFWFFV